MKKIIVPLMMIFCACIAYAEHENISTSQYYVDVQSATKQDAVPANNANSVMTYDSTSADGIGSKAIYDTSASYAGQSKALVTASAANTAIQNGINNEFVCKNPPECTLWKIRNTTPHASGKNLFDINRVPSVTWNGSGIVNNHDGTITVTGSPTNSAIKPGLTLSELVPDLVVGNTYTLSLQSDYHDNEYITLIYGTGSNRIVFSWINARNRTITQTDLDSLVYFQAPTNMVPVNIWDIQIEEGDTATAYEPYKNLYMPANQ